MSMIRRFITWLIRPSVEAMIAESLRVDMAQIKRALRWERQDANTQMAMAVAQSMSVIKEMQEGAISAICRGSSKSSGEGQ